MRGSPKEVASQGKDDPGIVEAPMHLGWHHPRMTERDDRRLLSLPLRSEYQPEAPAYELIAEAVGEPERPGLHGGQPGAHQEVDRSSHAQDSRPVGSGLLEASRICLEGKVVFEILAVVYDAIGPDHHRPHAVQGALADIGKADPARP